LAQVNNALKSFSSSQTEEENYLRKEELDCRGIISYRFRETKPNELLQKRI
jgi:hypothetical protein